MICDNVSFKFNVFKFALQVSMLLKKAVIAG